MMWLEVFVFNNTKIILFWAIISKAYSFCRIGKGRGLSVLLIKMKIFIN